ncbi:MAG: PHP domain-containing protein [bacterium]
MQELVDLHVHTTYSDGDMTPAEVVAEAVRLGLAGVAITDHDAVVGIGEAIEASPSGFEIIPGVELSTSDGRSDIHVLGYFVDPMSQDLIDYLKIFRDARLKRGVEMVKRLREMGVAIEIDSVLEIAGDGAVGRPHIAAALVRNGVVESTEEAFRNYIGFHSPAYVPKYQLKPADAFDLIQRAGGVGAFAHPGTTKREDLIIDFLSSGMKAIEVYHPKHSEDDVFHFLGIARKLGLIPTGGSDSHGRRDSKLLLGTCAIPLSTLDELRKARSL